MLLIQCKRDDLLVPLQSVCGIVEKRQTLPILANVLITKAGDGLTVLSTDIEMQITTRAAGKLGPEDVAITVGGRKLQDILRSLPEDSDLGVSIDEQKLSVRAGRSRFSLQTLPAEDYPRMAPAEGDTVTLQLPQREIKHLLSLVQYAMAQQDIRYYLNGLLLVAAENELRMVATDGHRLAFASEKLPEALSPAEAILPRRTVQELNRLLADTDDALEMNLAANQVTFRFGGIELISKLIDGKFPDYQRVIPQSYTQQVRLDRISLLKALQRVAILTNEKFRGVRLVLTTGSLRIASSNSEHEEAQEELEIDYTGEPIDIGFNVNYLLDVLNNVSGSEVSLHLSDANSSALFTLPENDSFKYVVMPMRV